MLSFPASLRVFIALEPCDMRAGINTLHALVADKLKEEVRGGALFVFTNNRRRLIKVLHFDGTGCWLMTKRERAATFYTLIGNCHRAGINAEAYLAEIFERLPEATTLTVRELTPHAMAAQRRAVAHALATAWLSAQSQPAGLWCSD